LARCDKVLYIKTSSRQKTKISFTEFHSSVANHDDEDGDEEKNENSTTPAASSTACVLTTTFLFIVLLSVAIASFASLSLCVSSSRRSEEDR
jgi:hypothetical protein